VRLVVFGVPAAAARYLPRVGEVGAEWAGLVLSPPAEAHFGPLAEQAQGLGADVFVLDPAQTDALAAALAEHVRPDLIVSIGCNQRIPDAILGTASLGAVNLHPSLLPAYRGACPQFWALANGERRTGVTAHYMVHAFDAGAVIAAESVEVAEDETLGSLSVKLTEAEERAFFRVLELFRAGTAPLGIQQDAAKATRAPKVRARHLEIDTTGGVERALRLVRAANPYYGARTRFDGRRMLVYRARRADESRDAAAPGELRVAGGVPLLGCADGALVPEVVELEGIGFLDCLALGQAISRKNSSRGRTDRQTSQPPVKRLRVA